MEGEPFILCFTPLVMGGWPTGLEDEGRGVIDGIGKCYVDVRGGKSLSKITSRAKLGFKLIGLELKLVGLEVTESGLSHLVDG